MSGQRYLLDKMLIGLAGSLLAWPAAAPDAPIRPYAGIGFNYNAFSNESGQLNTLAVKVGYAFGAVAEVGADPTLNDELDVSAFIVGAGLG